MPLCSVWVESHSTRKGVVPYGGVGGFQRGALIRDEGQFQLVRQNQPSFVISRQSALGNAGCRAGQAAHGFLLTDFSVVCMCSSDLR